MNNDREIIPVFFAVDDGYVPFLAVAMQSLIDNSSEEYRYEIKILFTEITEDNKKKILKSYTRENIEIEFVNLTEKLAEITEKLYTRDYYSKTTYYRLFLPELYPEYDKVLYLDSDMVILSNVAELYKIDIGNNLLGAVPDGVVQSSDIFQDYVEKVVGVSDYNNYFNAGALLLNLEELRKFDFLDKFLYLLENIKFKVAQDQDYLNRLCKGRTVMLDSKWNVMPGGIAEVGRADLNIIHYNLSYKPWHYDNIMYQDYFWEYATKTKYYDEIMEIKNNYTDEQRNNDLLAGENLVMMAKNEADCVGDDRSGREEREKLEVEKSEERLEILKRIEELEREGKFDIDAEIDPPSEILEADRIDYLKKKTTSKLKSLLANKVGERFLNNLIKKDKLIIKKINGLDNLEKVESGALITCNHFNPFDCFAVEAAFRMSEQSKNKKLFKVIREGNYTNFPGLYGYFFRNCDTLPLSSSNRTMIKFMQAVDTILQRGDFILIYPEQSLWWNYRKPKPLKNGAFKFAARNNVPVIPIFITMEDSEIIGDDGFPIQEYIINIDEPIYPKNDLTERENVELMNEKNYTTWVRIYEDYYKIPLEYNTVKDEEKEIESV